MTLNKIRYSVFVPTPNSPKKKLLFLNLNSFSSPKHNGIRTSTSSRQLPLATALATCVHHPCRPDTLPVPHIFVACTRSQQPCCTCLCCLRAPYQCMLSTLSYATSLPRIVTDLFFLFFFYLSLHLMSRPIILADSASFPLSHKLDLTTI